MMEQIINVPTLRFPEFEGEWEAKKINEILEPISNKVKVEENKLYQQIGIRSHGKGVFHKEAVTGKSLGNKRVFWVKENMFIVNIVFAWEQAVAKTTKKEIGMIASHRFPMYKPLNNLCDIDYILYKFLTKHGKFLLGLASPGGAGRNKTLGQNEFKKLKVIVPMVEEQQKIADFLLCMDSKIKQLTKKKEHLECFKKGVMQQIFSQTIRFKDDNGNDYPDWEVKNFGEIVCFMNTNSFSRSLLNYENGDVKNIHYGDIHKKFKTSFNISKEDVPFINSDIDISKFQENCYCKIGDLIIADASEDYKDIGKSIEIVNLNNAKLLAGLHTYIARDIERIALGFKGYLFQSYLIRIQIMKFATGISVLGISKGNLSKIKINLPSFSVQQKIANFLTELDNKINLIEKKINGTKLYKKSLLQQMFV